jgi:molybdopterin/thiamine biosynthesis adenylyltransferase/rhodanese-related sulfurtransferase
MTMTLTQSEMTRYSRHLILPDIGMAGQLKLKQARVLCIGAGGLGSPLILYLAAAGVGTLGLMDPDVVDTTNLHRQVLHHTTDVGREKVESAREKVRLVNPEVNVHAYPMRLTAENAERISAGYDIIVDGTDNFPTRYLTNDVCVLLKKPNVHASIFRFDGQASVFDVRRGPCYRCLYPEAPPPDAVPSCAEGGVLGVLPGLLGVIQATEVIKLITGVGKPLIGRILSFDALSMRSRELRIQRNPHCPACGETPTLRNLTSFDYQEFCGLPAPGAAGAESALPEVSPVEVHALLTRSHAGLVTVDVRERHEWDICRIEGAVHMPLDNLPARMGELDRSKTIVVYCLAGARSRKAQKLLHENGFTTVLNMYGGIREWAKQVDPGMPIY